MRSLHQASNVRAPRPAARRALLAVAAAALAAALAPAARADVIEMKDGRRIEGRIVSQSESALVLEVPYGTLTLPAEDIARIVIRPSPAEELAERRAALEPTDAAGRVALARFAFDRLQSTPLSRELALEAWKIDPASGAKAVLEELGGLFDGEEWRIGTEWYPRNGFVREGKRWITVEEAGRRGAAEALALTERDLASAKRSLRQAEAAIVEAAKAAGLARADAAAARAEADGLAARRATAEAELAARQQDVNAATELVRYAQLTLAQCQRDQMGRAQPDASALSHCRAELDLAQRRLALADRRRADALVELNAVTTKEASAHAAIAQAARDLARAEADQTAAELALPAVRDRIAELQAALPAAKAALAQATAAAEARAVLVAEDARRRAAALDERIRAAQGGPTAPPAAGPVEAR